MQEREGGSADMDEKDVQFLKTTAVVIVMVIAAALGGVYNGMFPESFSAPIRAVIGPSLAILAVVVLCVLVLRAVARMRGKRVRERNSVFASFMGTNWNGKEGITVSKGRGGVVTKVKLKLPPAQPLYEERFQERLMQAAKARMGTDQITSEPDLSRHTITFRTLNETQKKELERVRSDQQITEAFAPFMPNDWDQRSRVTWGQDPRVTPCASHGYTTVNVAVSGKWSLADDDVREKLRSIAATKLGTDNLTAEYDAVRNTARFAVFTVTAEIAAERAEASRVTELEENFRGFFAKPVKATVTQWDQSTGEPLSFVLKYEPQRGDYLESFAMRLEQGASTKLERRMSVTLRPKAREVHFEPRPELAKLIEHPGLSLYENQQDARTLLHLGEDIMGKIASWELSATAAQPHAIFAGPTRSGKSASMRNVILGCAYHGIEMLCLDPKYKEFLAWQKFPNVRSVATRTDMIVEGIEFVHDHIMEPRYKLAGLAIQQGKPEPKFPPFVLLIDEWIVASREIRAWWKANKKSGDPAEHPALEMMTKMLVKAAGANIHILMGMQRMDVEFIPGAARDQVSFRLALGKISAALANMAFESYYAGAGMPLLQGRGLINPDGVLTEAQIFKIDEPSSEDTTDQDIIKAFLERAIEHDKTAEWIVPRGKFDTDLAAEVNSAMLRAVAEAKNPPPPADEEAAPAIIGAIEVPAVSTAVGTIVAGDTIRNPEGLIGIVTEVNEVQDGDEWGVEITALFGSEVVTELFTEDSVIDRVDVIPDEKKEKQSA
jgi:FtsK/SpoIIIE family